MERQRAKHLWSFRGWVWQGRRDQGQQHRDNEHQTTVPLLQRSQRQVLWLLLPWRGRIYLRGESVPFVRRKGCSDRSVFGRFKFVPLNPNTTAIETCTNFLFSYSIIFFNVICDLLYRLLFIVFFFIVIFFIVIFFSAGRVRWARNTLPSPQRAQVLLRPHCEHAQPNRWHC